ncbi:MAG: alpha/beta hydrolase-fold protein [Anaerolineae bacterium]
MTDWLARAMAEGTPLIDGATATFVWAGETAPTIRSDMTGWWPGAEPWRMTQAAPGVWTYSREFPDDAYLEYGYFEGEARRLDPFSRRLMPNGVGSINNYLAMPHAFDGAQNMPRPGVPVGQVIGDDISAPTLTGGHRSLALYRPAAPGPYPLLVVFDGKDYLERALLPILLDNMIADGAIPPLAAVMVNNHPEARIAEYASSEATLTFLVDTLLPWVGERVPLVDTPGAHAVAGASMGGLMALFAGLRQPDLFGHVLSQSGAFGWRGNQLIFTLAELTPRPPVRVYLSVGEYEWLYKPNLRMRDTLRDAGYDYQYRAFHAGHNYAAWALDLPRGLTWLYGNK